MLDDRTDGAFHRIVRTIAQAFVGVITALIPHIGYATASKLAREALATNANIADLVVSSGLMTREHVDELLTPERLTRH